MKKGIKEIMSQQNNINSLSQGIALTHNKLTTTDNVTNNRQIIDYSFFQVML